MKKVLFVASLGFCSEDCLPYQSEPTIRTSW
jgi:hypothetical protein